MQITYKGYWFKAFMLDGYSMPFPGHKNMPDMILHIRQSGLIQNTLLDCIQLYVGPKWLGTYSKKELIHMGMTLEEYNKNFDERRLSFAQVKQALVTFKIPFTVRHIRETESNFDNENGPSTTLKYTIDLCTDTAAFARAAQVVEIENSYEISLSADAKRIGQWKDVFEGGLKYIENKTPVILDKEGRGFVFRTALDSHLAPPSPGLTTLE